MTIGDRIKTLREKRGLSQTDLADKLAIKKQTLYKYENNVITNIPSNKIEELAKILNVSPAFLMGWDDTEPKSSESYYINDDAKELAEFLFKNPEYKVLFDASRNVKKDDIEFVKQMLDRMKDGDGNG